MKVGTDAVLLGAWVNTGKVSSVLDVGTGCGIIALMCAQRSTATIDAVEIDGNAYEQASENFRKSPWSDRIAAYHNSLASFAVSRTTKYDLVISNPPFFRNSLKPPDAIRSTARHDEQLNYESLLYYTRKVCSDTGKLAVIIPAKDSVYLTDIASLYGFHVLRKTMVNSRQGQSPVRCLLELSGEFATDIVTGNISIRKEKGNEYTDEYIELTREFYLKM
jgi:tRNA1Val (adenine37-N6)-methyltransferase